MTDNSKPTPSAAPPLNGVVNPTPKMRFMSSNQNVSAHRAMIESREFERACDFALMEYQTRLCMVAEPNNQVACIAMAMRIQGAQEFLSTLRNLGETPRQPAPIELTRNLDHKA